jgi:hypothetical protein
MNVGDIGSEPKCVRHQDCLMDRQGKNAPADEPGP